MIPQLILASASPRRHSLLQQAGIRFTIQTTDVEELHDPSLEPPTLCEWNARLKAMAVAQASQGASVLGADTLVFLDHHVLGKPTDLADAQRMLRLLSGRQHQVCTGICLVSPDGSCHCFHETTHVYFRPLTDAQILHYTTVANPLDKAGSYGIQEFGELIIEKIDGNIDNVMGLPVALVTRTLQQFHPELL